MILRILPCCLRWDFGTICLASLFFLQKERLPHMLLPLIPVLGQIIFSGDKSFIELNFLLL